MSVTLEDLRQYRSLKESIKAIEMEIASLYYPVSSPPLMSEGGHSGEPGDPTARAFRRIEKDRQRLEKKSEELEERKAVIDAWLDTIEDSHISAIIRYHFVIGLTWRQTSQRVYGYTDADICRVAVKRFFDKM